MQKLMLTGNLGNDATLRTVGNKTAINFSVAHSEKFKNKDGITEEKTVWWDCTIWRNDTQSTEVAKYLKKGGKVLVEGEPQAETYTDKQGKTSISLKCFVKNLELLSVAPKAEQQEASQQQQQSAQTATSTPVTNVQDDDLPF